MKKAERQSNFELMRLISMFFIVGWHVIVRGEIFNTGKEPLTMISNIIMGIIIVHVNSLFFITGYFNSEKEKVNKRKVWKLIGNIWFYRILFLLLFLYLGLIPITNILIGEELFPLDMNNYWFMSCYLIVYIISPYLNKVIENMDEKNFFHLVALLFIILSVLPALTNLKAVNNDGFNIMQFILVYYIGAYLKKFPLKDNFHFKKLSERQLRFLLLFSFFFILFIRISIFYLGDKLISFQTEESKYLGMIIRNSYFRYSSPLVILQSCSYCLLFETFHFHNKLINFCAKSTLGIYLVHENIFVREVIYKILKIGPYHRTLKSIVLFFIYTAIIYIGSLLIEMLRRLLSHIIHKIKLF